MAATPIDSSTSDDRHLVEAARAGDYNAFEELVRRHSGHVYRLAKAMTQSVTDAEEISQETFLSVFNNLETYRGVAEPAAWILRIATNFALMRLRNKRRKPNLSLEELPDVEAALHEHTRGTSWAKKPDEILLDAELRGVLQNAADKLPDKYRLVFLLRDIEGLSTDEVANTLGLTPLTIKARLHRSRLFMRQEVETYYQNHSMENHTTRQAV